MTTSITRRSGLGKQPSRINVSATRTTQVSAQRSRFMPKGGSACERDLPNRKLPAYRSGARVRKK